MKLAQVALMLGVTGLAACSPGERDIRLHRLKTNSGQPEEFAILPTKPLQTPPNFAELPAPVPGAANRTDPTPKADAVAALGGNPARLAETGAPAGDGALIGTASRFGRDPQIRTRLAAEDLAYRKRKSLFSYKIVPQDEYYDAYRSQWLDTYAVLDAFRRAGARTPSAPPQGYED
ncbi:hypothetical protein AL036_03025 [Salipiger aestuarii]|uniref:Beta-barrel assembly complex subunit BamF n=2 Tax=Salipiger aestuarii TaxID=568098 RepID=A0A327YQV1_9RHOB|nr:hypothetical protein AL036_03025 [Salipiger aestuarii]KAA8614047.1 hypothetical protein AL037_04835 [Salipiger aestuarii]KAB2543797.1 hypothetical protein AL035_00340 [Salipiger aestuarii]RAK22892.1 beta-barrel assembly complex subunit BamF [Salipiger aestuarii]